MAAAAAAAMAHHHHHQQQRHQQQPLPNQVLSVSPLHASGQSHASLSSRLPGQLGFAYYNTASPASSAAAAAAAASYYYAQTCHYHPPPSSLVSPLPPTHQTHLDGPMRQTFLSPAGNVSPYSSSTPGYFLAGRDSSQAPHFTHLPGPMLTLLSSSTPHPLHLLPPTSPPPPPPPSLLPPPPSGPFLSQASATSTYYPISGLTSPSGKLKTSSYLQAEFPLLEPQLPASTQDCTSAPTGYSDLQTDRKASPTEDSGSSLHQASLSSSSSSTTTSPQLAVGSHRSDMNPALACRQMLPGDDEAQGHGDVETSLDERLPTPLSPDCVLSSNGSETILAKSAAIQSQDPICSGARIFDILAELLELAQTTQVPFLLCIPNVRAFVSIYFYLGYSGH
ncbi:unnamed protein product [Protopolystoma xenopodis]|uniref:Uncharacterized protein n=1 Tax=Protopolystoma xenopodis TaxID=117903 RepID=A0A3S5B0J9_9PLAT|nr:unnamed protein product [Protopolystoma xenopodis]